MLLSSLPLCACLYTSNPFFSVRAAYEMFDLLLRHERVVGSSIHVLLQLCYSLIKS